MAALAENLPLGRWR